MRKLLLIILYLCFLLGMVTKAEVKNLADSDIIGNWTQKEIEYFQNKEYLGDEKPYILFSLHYYPSYIKERLLEEDPYNKVAYEENIITERAIKQFVSLSIENKKLLKRYFILLKAEILARKGYIFESADLKKFFSEMNWYKPRLKAVELNERERRNLKEVKELEEIVKSTKVISEFLNKQVLLKASWGEGPGEFALEPLNETFIWETYIAVDNEGYIYLADPNNLRVNVFDKNGTYVRNFPIPEDFTYVSKYGSSALLEGIGADDEGYLYFGSSSAYNKDAPGQAGEVILKTDKKGEVLERYSLPRVYAYPLYFCAVDGEVYLSGVWKTGISTFYKAVLPLEYAKAGSKSFSVGVLSAHSLNKNNNRILMGDKSIEILEDRIPRSFNISGDSRVVYYSGKDFIFTYLDRKERTRVPIFWSSHTPGHGFPYKGGKVKASAVPFIDKDLNIYSLDGTDTHLHVIKYTPNDEVWR